MWRALRNNSFISHFSILLWFTACKRFSSAFDLHNAFFCHFSLMFRFHLFFFILIVERTQERLYVWKRMTEKRTADRTWRTFVQTLLSSGILMPFQCSFFRLFQSLPEMFWIFPSLHNNKIQVRCYGGFSMALLSLRRMFKDIDIATVTTLTIEIDLSPIFTMWILQKVWRNDFLGWFSVWEMNLDRLRWKIEFFSPSHNIFFHYFWLMRTFRVINFMNVHL